jgi:hypothetical protein
MVAAKSLSTNLTSLQSFRDKRHLPPRREACKILGMTLILECSV